MGNTPSSGENMRAIVHDKAGKDYRSFRIDYPKPLLTKPNQVLVKVKAAAINPVDYKLPMMLVGGKPIGLDFSGVVEESRSDQFKVGERVFGNAQGCLADFVMAEAGKITHLPPQLSWQQGAALPTVYLTSYQALKRGNFQSGQSLLVIGASGGCGTSGVQLAKAWGASDIAGVCSGRNEEFVRSLGATSTMDYTKTNVLAAFGKARFDMVYDCATGSGAGEDYTKQSFEVLKPAKKLVAINGGPATWIGYGIGVQSVMDTRHQLLLTNHSQTDLNAILGLMLGPSSASAAAAAGPASTPLAFAPIIERVLPFSPEGMSEGFELLKSRRARGKLVFDVNPQD